MIGSRALAPLLALGLSGLLGPAAVRAQTWSIDASAGAATHEAVAADVGTRSAMLGIRYDGSLWLYVSGGLPLDEEGVPWSAGGAGLRSIRQTGPLDLGFVAAGHAHAYKVSDLDASGAGATLSAAPLIAWGVDALRVEAYTGGLLYHRAFEQAGERESATRTLHDSGAGFVLAASEGLLLRVDGRYLRADEDSYPFVGGSASYGSGPVQAWAAAGQWGLDGAGATGWEIGTRLELGRSIRAFASYAREPTDPIYWNAPRQRWTVGLSRELGGMSTPTPAPAAPVPVVDAGERVTFRLPARGLPEAPAVAGDFTGWKPVQMVQQDGEWVIELAVDPGLHHYAFVRADGSWFVPESLPSVDDGFGGTSAVLIVR